MSTLTESHPALGPSTASDIPSLAAAGSRDVLTRRKFPSSRFAERSGLVTVGVSSDEREGRHTIVTRRQAFIRKRRRKRLLIAGAFVLALFPPVWAIYLIAWLVWRSRAPQKSMRNVRKGIRALEKNQTGVALKRLQEAHLLDPGNTDALYWLGLLLSQQERLDEAEEALSIVAARVPGLPEVEAALARTYLSLGESDRAVFHAQRVAEAAPFDTASLLLLADAFEADGRIDMAIEALQRAPLHRSSPDELLLRAHYRLGELHERSGDAETALRHFKRVYARSVSYRDIKARVDALENAAAGRDSGESAR